MYIPFMYPSAILMNSNPDW